MARLDYIERLRMEADSKSNGALSFDFWRDLHAPPIRLIFSEEDINELKRIATSIKLAAKKDEKLRRIDSIMRSRGFVRLYAGTNRIAYRFPFGDQPFVAKVAIDRVGMADSPREYINQFYLYPWCIRTFEYAGDGVLAFFENVSPILCEDEFRSVFKDIYRLMTRAIIGKYVVEDLGFDKFKNFGNRIYNGCQFGPVVLDYPYVYKLDPNKMICHECGGEIDYDDKLSYTYCTKCGRIYAAKELGTSLTEIPYEEYLNIILKGENSNMTIRNSDNRDKPIRRVRFVTHYGDGRKVVTESESSSKTYHNKRPNKVLFTDEVEQAGKIRFTKLTPVSMPKKDKIKTAEGFIRPDDPYLARWVELTKYRPDPNKVTARSGKPKNTIVDDFARIAYEEERAVTAIKDLGIDVDNVHYSTEEFVDKFIIGKLFKLSDEEGGDDNV